MTRARPGLCRRLACCAIWLLLGWHVALAGGGVQGAERDTLRPRRPKLGLVLSGGGARGFVHIGLLRVMEEEGLRPDYVTGTSMGAILGAMYAIGYSPTQISELNRSMNLNEQLTDEVDMRTVSVEQKSTVGRFLLQLAWHEGAFRLPPGLVESQQIWQTMGRMFWPVAGTYSFDDFPTPYRCCAVDIFRGRVVTFSEGSLVKAARSSMAIPGIFSPVQWGDSSVMVDGGVSDNFPIDAARQLGAEITIGSYSGAPIYEADSVRSFSAGMLIKQASLYTGIQKARGDLDKFDLLFMPDLHDVNAMSFGRGVEVEEYGYREAQKLRPQLRALARRLDSLGPGPTVRPVDTSVCFNVSEVVVDGVGETMRRFALQRMNLPVPGRLCGAEVDAAISHLYSTRYFKRAVYHIDREGRLHVELAMEDRVKLQLSYEVNEAWGAGVAGRISVLNPLLPSSRIAMAVGLSYYPWLRVNFTQYFSQHNSWLFNWLFDYNSSRFPIYKNSTQIAGMWRHQGYTELEFGRAFGYNTLLTAGLSYGVQLLDPNAAYITHLDIEDPGRVGAQALQAFARLQANTYDRPYYPRRGTRFFAQASYRYTPESWLSNSTADWSKLGIEREFKDRKLSWKAVMEYGGVYPLSRHVSLRFGLGAGISLEGSRYSGFFIGGQKLTGRTGEQFPFYGLPYRMHSYYAFALGTLGLRMELWPNVYLEPVGNLVVGRRSKIMSWDDVQHLWVDHITGGGLRAGWLTRFGLLELGVGASTYSPRPWFYAMVGYPL